MERIKRLLQEKGLKVTTQRIIVYQVMERLCHATADSVAKEVRSIVPTITVATVYHILESLCQTGLISRLDTRDGKIGYDITAKTHHHLFDAQQRRIEDYDDAGLTHVVREYLAAHPVSGFTVDDVAIWIDGRFSEKNS
ncbi:MAG TPA: transcriptional repressor [Candidatus Alistipes merdigallinarum]|nr:transcriptional repressor [Candidatus Alistipes merdigallinarum]